MAASGEIRPRRYSAMAAMEQIIMLSDEESDSEESVSDVDEDEREIQVPHDGGDEEEEDETSEEELAPLTQRLNLGRLTSPNGEVWHEEPPRGGRRPARNILRNQPGPTPYAAARLQNELSAFLLIFDNDMIETLVVETNREGHLKHGEAFQPTSIVEMRAYIGLCILRGVYKGHLESVDELFSEEHGRLIFRKTMTLSRFKLLRRHLRFDNRATRNARLQRDKLAAVRLLLDGLTNNSQKCYFPGPAITIDEQLYPYRGRCKFVQYIPSKPAKYGLKFWSLNDSQTAYCWNLQMYVGRDENRQGRPLGEHVVLTLVEKLRGSGLNVTVDNFFCSLQLARQLMSMNMTLLGTMRANRREVPTELRYHRGKELFASKFVYTNDGVQLVSYKAKQTKIVLVLSSQHSTAGVANAENRKPQSINDYNKTKGGTDQMDQMIGSYTTKYKSRRWHVPVFCNVLDIACLNSYVLHKHLIPECNAGKPNRRRLFLLTLGYALTEPATTARSQITAPRALGPADGPLKGRCHLCNRSADRKTRTKCSSCTKFTCQEHLQQVCMSCFDVDSS